MKNKKKIFLLVIAICICLVGILDATYAWWSISKNQDDSNHLAGGCLNFKFESADETKQNITLQNTYPISDWEGMNLEPYIFTVTNYCSTPMDYDIYLDKLSTSTMNDSAVAIIFDYGIFDTYNNFEEKENSDSTISKRRKLADDTVLGATDSEHPTVNTHYLRIWMDEDATNDDQNNNFNSKITISAGQGVKKYYTPEECFEYETPTNGTVSIKGFANGYDKSLCGTDLVLPYEITDSNSGEKYTVTSLYNTAFSYGTSSVSNDITSVEIPRTITKIGHAAFRGYNLNKVILKDGLLEFGQLFCAGANISNLSRLEFYMIPSTVTKIGGTKFTNLKNIIIPDNVTSLYGSSNFQFNKIENFSIGTGLTTIPNEAFEGNQIENVVIPGHIKKISYGVFAGNPIKSITLNEGLEEIGSSCFNNQLVPASYSEYRGITNPYRVDIPSTVIKISDDNISYAFDFQSDKPGILNFVGRTSIPISTDWYRNATVLCNGTTCTN